MTDRPHGSYFAKSEPEAISQAVARCRALAVDLRAFDVRIRAALPTEPGVGGVAEVVGVLASIQHVLDRLRDLERAGTAALDRESEQPEK